MANSATTTTKAAGSISAKVVTNVISTTITVVETDRTRDRVETATAATSLSNRKPNTCPLMPVWPLKTKCKTSRCSRSRSQLILKPRWSNSNNSNR